MRNNILTIYKREMLEFIRDKRVLISSIIIPLLLFPIIMFGVSYFFSKQISKVSRETIQLGYGSEITRTYLKEMFTAPLFVIKKVTKDNYKDALKNKTVNFFIDIEEGKQLIFNIYYDKSRTTNEIKYSKIKNQIEKYKDNLVRTELKKKNIENILDRIKINSVNIATKKKMGLSLLAMFLPYLLIIISLSGASYVAIDTTVGEKERGTIETLLSSPSSRRDIVLGKYLSVITVSVIATLLAITSVNISMTMFPNINGVKFNMDILTTIIVLLSVLPISMIFSALVFFISSFSKSTKEAQSYIQPLMMLIIFPSMASIFPGIDQSVSVALTPIVNISILLKHILYGDINILFLVITLSESVFLLIIFIVLAFRSFERESIVFTNE